MTREAASAIAELAAGRASPLRRALAGLAGAGPPASTWRLALEAARAQVWPEEGATPKAADVRRAVGEGGDPEGAVMACALAARDALLAFDAEAAGGYATLAEELARSAEGRARAQIARMAERLLAGACEVVDARALDVFAATSRLGMAGEAVTVTAFRGLAALGAGDHARATSVARRASRMAQTEGLPQHSYLAHLVLARVRRVTGRPHLASRILGALSRVAPRPWWGWLGWERLMAGGAAEDVVLDRATTPSEVAVDALRGLLGALQTGHRGAFDAAVRALAEASKAWPEIGRDASDLVAALDAHAPLDGASPELIAWCAGVGALPPRGLVGVGAAIRRGDDPELAMVLAEPPAQGRRLLAGGSALLDPSIEPIAIQRSSRHKGRTETALCVLALAGGAEDGDALFQAVYGFVYTADLHAGVMDVLLHRARQRLGDAGAVRRSGGSVVLELSRPLLVADPRCTRAMDERLLSAVASAGATTAKEAAERVGLPLRTVQAALRQLVDDGVCIAERRGNHVEYRVEDTTFSEPTQH